VINRHNLSSGMMIGRGSIKYLWIWFW